MNAAYFVVACVYFSYFFAFFDHRGQFSDLVGIYVEQLQLILITKRKENFLESR